MTLCDHEYPQRYLPCTRCGERKPVSATETEKARGCLRAWAYRYATDLPSPPKKPSAFGGSGLHEVGEGYLRHGQLVGPEWARAMLKAGLPHLPAPGRGEVEVRAEVVLGGVPFVLAIDWLGSTVAVPGAAPEMPAVLDHKSSKDPARYGIWSRADRLDDPQTLIYDAAVLSRCDDHTVWNRWIYYKKTQDMLHAELEMYLAQGGEDCVQIERYQRAITNANRRATAKPSDQVLTRHEVRGGMERVVLPVAERIYHLRDRTTPVDPLDIEPNYDHCDAYGGCEYRGLCQPTPQDAFRAMIGRGNQMGLFDNLKNDAQINGAPGAAPPTASAPAAGDAPASGAFVFNTSSAPTPAPVPEVSPNGDKAAAPPNGDSAAPVHGLGSAPVVNRGDLVVARAAEPAALEVARLVGRALIAAGKVLAGEA